MLLSFTYVSNINAQVSVRVSIRIAPPVIPVYQQPVCPTEGYLWIPGYWGYGTYGYYWIPGYWTTPPKIGYLWTPGYWTFVEGFYKWTPGYWGVHVGYYGGINYGFGYYGTGFVGGIWKGSVFCYNTAVVHVNTVVVHNTYINKTVVVHTPATCYSYNGIGGVTRQATHTETIYSNEAHIHATSVQTHYVSVAGSNKTQYYSNNHGVPPTTVVTNDNTEYKSYNKTSVRKINNGVHVERTRVRVRK